MRVFTSNGVVTYETCPCCREPDVKVEHGHDTLITFDEDGRVVETRNLGLQHYEDCPVCGISMPLVCYDCEHCQEASS